MAKYLDGSPVVHGPFGGDDLQPWEIRIIEANQRRMKNRSVVKRILGRLKFWSNID